MGIKLVLVKSMVTLRISGMILRVFPNVEKISTHSSQSDIKILKTGELMNNNTFTLQS